MLAVLDTNIWISAILSPEGFCAPVLDAVRRGNFTPVVCPMMQHELTAVLTRPEFATQYRLRPGIVAETVMLSAQRSWWIADPEVVSVCRDPRDDMFIAVARASGAAFLVTRDDDLKDDVAVRAHLASSECEVVTVTQFVQELAQ